MDDRRILLELEDEVQFKTEIPRGAEGKKKSLRFLKYCPGNGAAAPIP
jgi:hypothetical protein